MKFSQPNIITTPDPVAKERAITNALREYRRSEYETPAAMPSLFARHYKGFAAGVAACLALLWAMPHPSSQLQTSDDVTLIREMRAVFGNQLNGIIESAGKVEPVVAEGNTFSDSQPILVTLQQGDKKLRILCFSGNTVTVPYSGKNLRLTTILNKEGNVIVEGDDFMWTNQQTVGAIPTGMQAEALEPSL